MKPRAAYVHVPFCHRRCPYCNFTVTVGKDDWVERYLRALDGELSKLGESNAVDTIFIGGGTPTLLSIADTVKLLASIRRCWPLALGGEWTIEANPEDLTDEKCRLLRELGVNRLSIGGQSFNDVKLQVLGRAHSGYALQSSIERARRYFDNVSLDLIFGVPGESIETWKSDLRTAASLDLRHVSTYGLTYEKGAAFWGQKLRGSLEIIPEETELAMYFEAIDYLGSVGFEHYEVSNFARPGKACRHNQAYWSLEPWYAVGPGAAAFVDGTRTVNHRSTVRWLQLIENRQSPIAESESIDSSQFTLERFVFGMRRMSGVDIEELSRSGHPPSLDKIRSVSNRHSEAGWMICEEGYIKLTRRGLAISDSLWSEYLV